MTRVYVIVFVLVMCVGVTAYAALPFSDPFASGGPGAGWTEWFNTGGTLTCVSSDVDWRSVTINPPSGSDGYFGKSTFNASTYASHGWKAGDTTDTNYTVEAKIFVPQVSGTAEPDDYLYQQLLVFVDEGAAQYIRLHAQYNNDTLERCRVQIILSSFLKTVSQSSVFTGGDGWHTFKAVMGDNLPQGDFYIDSTQISGATITWTTEGPTVTKGQFGFGQFIDGVGERSVYVDEFSATANPTTVSDWPQYE
jgi:hypothetical protein